MANDASEAGAILAGKRWKKTTKAQRKEVGTELAKSRWANATPEERAEQGRRLAEARAKARAKKGKRSADK